MFRIVQKYLNKTKTELYTYSLPKETTLKVLINKLLPDISAPEVDEELQKWDSKSNT